METKKILKVAGAIGAGIVLIGAGALGTGIVKNDTIQDQAGQISQLQLNNSNLVENIVDLNNAEPVIEYKTEVETVYENVTVEVEVDNGNLDLVLNEIYDNKGIVEYLTEDLDEDELDQVVDRIVFVNEIKELALAEVKAEFKDLMDKEDYVFNAGTVNETSVEFDEDDVERVRIQGDADEVKTEDVDYEDKDGDVLVDVKFEQDDVKYLAKVIVEIKDGEVEDLDLDSVSLR